MPIYSQLGTMQNDPVLSLMKVSFGLFNSLPVKRRSWGTSTCPLQSFVCVPSGHSVAPRKLNGRAHK